MTNIDLSADAELARAEIEPHIVRLLGLLQMWHMFQSAQVVADEFHSKFDELSYQLKIACTRSLVVDYLKPWSGNFSPEINSLKVYAPKKQWAYPFLDAAVQTDTHAQLVELRNSTVAHLDQDYEGGGLSLKGIKIPNAPAGGKQNGTLDEVFLPATTVVAGVRGLWWLSDKGKLSEICDHIENSRNLVEQEIRYAASDFRQACINHMHVLGELNDLFGIVEMPLVEGHANVTSQAEDPKPLSNSSPKQLSIGDQNIQSLVTVYEPRPEYPTETEFDGKGYKLTIGTMTDQGQLQFSISFPTYPHPKGH